MTGKLSIVPTPIGNLGDMTSRAIETLRIADVVCAEDTRVTGKLLTAFAVHAKLERCDENVIAQRAGGLVQRMAEGEHVAFCSDAGMPGVSDPGLVLVDAAREADIPVEVLPGACAVPTALVAAGFPGSPFYFGGFLPRKAKPIRELLQSLSQLDAALVFYESPHRVAASVALIAEEYPTRRVALCRELTKLHEEVLRLPANDLAQELAARESIKGEIVLVIESGSGAQQKAAPDDEQLREQIQEALRRGVPKSQVVKELSTAGGISRNELYNLVHELAKETNSAS